VDAVVILLFLLFVFLVVVVVVVVAIFKMFFCFFFVLWTMCLKFRFRFIRIVVLRLKNHKMLVLLYVNVKNCSL